MALVTVPTQLIAVTRKVKTPSVVGVPDTAPVLVLSVKPFGNVPEAREKVGVGKPLKVVLCE